MYHLNSIIPNTGNQPSLWTGEVARPPWCADESPKFTLPQIGIILDKFSSTNVGTSVTRAGLTGLAATDHHHHHHHHHNHHHHDDHAHHAHHPGHRPKCFWAGRGRLWRVTGCFDPVYDKTKTWSNLACYHRSDGCWSAAMEAHEVRTF